MVRNIPNRNTIEDFTEEIVNLLLSVALPSSSLVIMAVSIPHWVVESDSLLQDEDSLREDYYYQALAFSRHTINLEFDEETMKPEKATEAPRNAGIDPSTMKMKQWYQAHDRVSDQKAPTGTERASYQVREPIKDDAELLATRLGDMLPPVLERIANPKNSRRPSSTGLPTKLGKDAPCHLQGRRHKSMV